MAKKSKVLDQFVVTVYDNGRIDLGGVDTMVFKASMADLRSFRKRCKNLRRGRR